MIYTQISCCIADMQTKCKAVISGVDMETSSFLVLWSGTMIK